MIRDKEGLSYWERKAKAAADEGNQLGVTAYLMHYECECIAEELEKFSYPNTPSKWQLRKRWKQFKLFAEYGRLDFALGLLDHVLFDDEP